MNELIECPCCGTSNAIDSKEASSLVKIARNVKGWTQADVAKAAGISKSSVQNIENNELIKNREPVKRVLTALGMNPEEERFFATGEL